MGEKLIEFSINNENLERKCEERRKQIIENEEYIE